MTRNASFRLDLEDVLSRESFAIAEPLEDRLLRNANEARERGLRSDPLHCRPQRYNFR